MAIRVLAVPTGAPVLFRVALLTGLILLVMSDLKRLYKDKGVKIYSVFQIPPVSSFISSGFYVAKGQIHKHAFTYDLSPLLLLLSACSK